MINRLLNTVCYSALSFVFLLHTAQAQEPLYKDAADIPLDVEILYQQFVPEADYKEITKNIVRQLSRNHYEDIRIDDSFSSLMLDRYIEALDRSKIYFLQSDIDTFERYRTKLDDTLKKGNTDPGYEIFNLYQQRLIDRLVYAIDRIENDDSEFDFTIDEAIIIDRENVPRATSREELQDLWRKRVKSSVLSLRMDDEEMEEIKEKLSKRFRSQLNQVLKTNSLDVYQRYMNALTTSFDPHTQYFAPRAAENFNMGMSLSLEGIGAILTTEDEFTKVVSLVAGGPAEIADDLRPSDRIVGVAQGEKGELVDVLGWRIGDVVDLIRGQKGSVVRLNIIPNSAKNDSETEIISITRDEVSLEDGSAKKEIVNIQHEGKNYKIGVIELPQFYIDFAALQRRDPNYRSTTKDVRKLLNELIAEEVDGVIVDLRNNGGGSLGEANSMVGLFIRRGPTVYVRDANDAIKGMNDTDPSIDYTGPLAVLVNRLSASASEIFAGAIQDYQRGLILGSRTFGKGTVQELIPLGEGQIKITRAKFYRISGESTQHRGVNPDIVYPDLYDAVDDVGESTLPTALPWDTIEPNYFRSFGEITSFIPELDKRHEKRIEGNPDFAFIRAQIARAEENKIKNEFTLNEETLRAERKESEEWRLNTENARRVAKGKEPFADIDELEGKGDDSEMLASEDSPIVPPSNPLQPTHIGDKLTDDLEPEEEEEPNAYLVESGRILMDLVELQGRGKLAVQ